MAQNTPLNNQRPLPGANIVTVGLTEFTIDMPGIAPAGTTIFDITNNGTMEHNLMFEGPGVAQGLHENLQPGDRRRLQVDLQPGTYKVYCPLEDHDGRGMNQQLTVTG